MTAAERTDAHERPGPPVAGIVLAAGRSVRMGRSKALLPVDGETFVENGVETLRRGGCGPVIVVVPPDGGQGDRLRSLVEEAGARAVTNPDPESEQIDSLRAGLKAIGSGPVAAVVLPVDFPLAGPAVVARLIQSFHERGAPIVRPVYHAQPGHPVLFARDVWDELMETDLEQGAREVIHRHHAEIRDVPVDDRGVTVDVDTPDDYEREVGGE